jgi:hypothetical protein
MTMAMAITTMDKATPAATFAALIVVAVTTTITKAILGGNRGGQGGNQARTQANDPCPLSGHANHAWGNCYMNGYNSNWHQSQPRDSRNVERRAPDNPQAVPPQSRAAAGSLNTSSHSNRPAHGTTF